MQTQTDSEDTILCPQITSVIVTILKILAIIGFLFNISDYGKFGFLLSQSFQLS